MADLNHSLYKEFPQHRERIHQLKHTNPDFAAKAAEYHKLDHRLCGLAESNVPTSDEIYESMKLRRLQLKDELFEMLRVRAA